MSRTLEKGWLVGADGLVVPSYSGPVSSAWECAQRFAAGGLIRGCSPHPRADNIPILATAGEVMQSNRAVATYGQSRLLAFNSGSVDPAAFDEFMRAQGLADGGVVGKAREAFTRPAMIGASSSTTGGLGGVTNNKNLTQNFNTYYPVSERESTATRRAATAASMGAML